MLQAQTFKNGDTIPCLGLGTWKMNEGSAYEAVKTALDLGYRHFDCAHIYGNELDVGAALAEALERKQVQRSDLWVTSKLWNDSHHPENVHDALKKTLKNLRLDFVDLYLIHWPIAHQLGVDLPETPDQFCGLDAVPLESTWNALEKCLDEGRCRHIGVANFSQKKLEHLLQHCRVQPEMNQVESHPFLQQNELLRFCQQNGILFTAYSPLGSADRPERLRKENEPSLLDHPRIGSIASRHQATAAQILLAWALNRKTIAIPKSANLDRMKENLESGAIQLDADEMGAIASLDRNFRFIDGQFWEKIGGPYTVAGLWDE